MTAIKTTNRTKQLITFISMLLFLFVYVDDLSSQQIFSKPVTPNTSIFAFLSPQAEQEMLQRAPAAFEHNVIISYSIPRQEEVDLRVYDKFGREIKTLVSDVQNPGTYSSDINASTLKYGVFYYRLVIGSFVEVKKFALVK